MNRGPFDRLAVAASLVFIADFSTKQWALRSLDAESDRYFGAGWHLAVVNNTHLAGGRAGGGLELPLTMLLTMVVAVLVLRVCRQLTAIDAGAPAILGMLLGSGAANLADALIPPRGVVDFLAFTGAAGDTVSFNVADVVLVVALGLSLRMMWRIAQTIRGRPRPSLTSNRSYSGALPMRDRLLVSAGHALLAMCAFVWLYSMAVALTPDAGRSAPNSLLCGIGVFAVAFVASQARLRVLDRRFAMLEPRPHRILERVVLDGSLSTIGYADRLVEQPDGIPRGDMPARDDTHPRHPDRA
ncbi:MAG TPA: signal peptidase II [Gemmatimonadaceae bacterium]|nr:signal peptidase II [Gemmatimonadaceae bacterium]